MDAAIGAIEPAGGRSATAPHARIPEAGIRPDQTPRQYRRAQRHARRMDRRVLRTAHPVASLIVGLMSRKGIVRIPRWGVVISSAVPMRDVLINPKRYMKNGRHGTGELFTRVFGPGMLMNSDGDTHRLLRRAIAPRFTAAQSRELCATFTQEIVDDTRERLLRGETVDFVQVAQLATGIATVRLAGWQLEGAELHARARHVYAKSIE
ncbi:MAG: hypothetical protein H7287_11015, partial [Thermoleophilia bacterium]|nr:hypothetical protein [Thermoleophilia bacterium]